MKFIRSTRYLWLGFTVGSVLQLPLLIGMQNWKGVIVQSILFAIACPLMLLGFFKK